MKRPSLADLRFLATAIAALATILTLAPIAGAAALEATAQEDDGWVPPLPTTRVRYAKVEGRVLAVSETVGEGELAVIDIRLETNLGERSILLAPSPVLDEMGFRVEPGDLIRARVFVDPDGRRMVAQQIQNRSRGLMVRLRTLRREPVWSHGGRLQGSGDRVPSEARQRRSPPVRRPQHRPPRRPQRRRSPR